MRVILSKRRLPQCLLGLILCLCLMPRPTVGAEAVILLHGLARSSASMADLEDAFRDAGFVVVNVDYPSRTASVRTLSREAIGGALEDPRLLEVSKIHFVTHSMGGILVRDYLAQEVIPRLGRVVMLGPPNEGSEVVDRLRSWRIFALINGPAGQELGTDAQSVPVQLGPVNFELGVIAGNRSINWINSLLIDGPDDGKVSVERTRVEGMKEHLVLPVTHPMMMRNSDVISACLSFLTTGSFGSTQP
jgi:triacylglycerol lipase